MIIFGYKKYEINVCKYCRLQVLVTWLCSGTGFLRILLRFYLIQHQYILFPVFLFFLTPIFTIFTLYAHNARWNKLFSRKFSVHYNNIFGAETNLYFTPYNIIFCRVWEKFPSYCLCYFDYKKISRRVNNLKRRGWDADDEHDGEMGFEKINKKNNENIYTSNNVILCVYTSTRGIKRDLP